MTPEGRVKAAVSRLLKKYNLYSHMAVPYGYGASTLDYTICVGGRYLSIETKAPGKRPTPRQDTIIERIRSSGGTVFVIDGTDETDTLADLKQFLDTHNVNRRTGKRQT